MCLFDTLAQPVRRICKLHDAKKYFFLVFVYVNELLSCQKLIRSFIYSSISMLYFSCIINHVIPDIHKYRNNIRINEEVIKQLQL